MRPLGKLRGKEEGGQRVTAGWMSMQWLCKRSTWQPLPGDRPPKTTPKPAYSIHVSKQLTCAPQCMERAGMAKAE